LLCEHKNSDGRKLRPTDGVMRDIADALFNQRNLVSSAARALYFCNTEMDTDYEINDACINKKERIADKKYVQSKFIVQLIFEHKTAYFFVFLRNMLFLAPISKRSYPRRLKTADGPP
jgi:hypothetical protein